MTTSHKPCRKSKRPRLDASVYGYSGYAVHIIIGTYLGKPVFGDNTELALLVTRTLRETAVARRIGLYCYCLMPDHLHFVATVEREGSDLKSFVKSFKTRIALATKSKANEPLWQRSFYDRVIRKHEDLREICLYIVNNPVRKGLTNDWRLYPFVWLSDEA